MITLLVCKNNLDPTVVFIIFIMPEEQSLGKLLGYEFLSFEDPSLPMSKWRRCYKNEFWSKN